MMCVWELYHYLFVLENELQSNYIPILVGAYWSNSQKSTCNSHFTSFSDVWETRWAFSCGLKSLSSIISCLGMNCRVQDRLWKSLSLPVILQYLSQTICRPGTLPWGISALQGLESHSFRSLERGKGGVLKFFLFAYK